MIFPQQLDGVGFAFFGCAGKSKLSSNQAVSPQDVVIAVNVVSNGAVLSVEFLVAPEATETSIRVGNEGLSEDFLERSIAVDFPV
jgi:hypothetical protein